MWGNSCVSLFLDAAFLVYENRTLAYVAFMLFILSIIMYSTNRCSVLKSMLDYRIVHLLMLTRVLILAYVVYVCNMVEVKGSGADRFALNM